jgi:hypothetical protein
VYFAKDVGCLLARVENDTSLGEFVLEQRERILTPYGASVGIQSGAVVADWWVERAKR